VQPMLGSEHVEHAGEAAPIGVGQSECAGLATGEVIAGDRG